MDIGQIVGMAKTFFPKYAAQLEQAQQIASQFQSSPEGVKQLMQQYGKSQEDLNKALSMLGNPVVGGILNRIQPGLVDQLRAAGQSLSSASTSHSMPNASSVTSSLDALRERLGKL